MTGVSSSNPRFPLYIPTKGRAESRLTHRALSAMQVPHFVVVESQEYNDYKAVLSEWAELLVLDPAYQANYNPCDLLGMTKGKGAGAVRNFIWDHSIALGAKWHWTMDDNISYFARCHANEIISLGDGGGFRVMEDFCLRYTNVAMAGPAYEMFLPRKSAARYPPFVLNTRIYSCNLIRNDVPFRWRGRLNEDTILSLDMLKAGWCTVQFNAFLQKKTATQKLKGGNTDEFYSKDGTFDKSKMLVDLHPDVSRLVWRFGRWHHHVDYTPFKKNHLIRKRHANTSSLGLVTRALDEKPNSL